MKKIFILFMTITILLSISACGGDKPNLSVVEQYKKIVQEYIDKGDIETAKKALAEGVTLTNDEDLKNMLEEMNSKESEAGNNESSHNGESTNGNAKPKEVIDYAEYDGVWSTEGFSWESGGVTMDIIIDGQEMFVTCSCVQSAPANRVADFNESIPFSSIIDSSFTTNYKDGWGNSGTVTFEFKDDAIICSFKDITSSDWTQWGFGENSYVLKRQKESFGMDEYTINEYLTNSKDFLDFDSKQEVTLETLSMANNRYNGIPYQYAVIDLDGDGCDELLVEYNMMGDTAILHIEDNKCVAYYISFRGRGNIKTDGTMSYSNGASDNGIHKISFSPEGLVIKKILECVDGVYKIDGKIVSEDIGLAELDKQNSKTDVIWNTLN